MDSKQFSSPSNKETKEILSFFDKWIDNRKCGQGPAAGCPICAKNYSEFRDWLIQQNPL